MTRLSNALRLGLRSLIVGSIWTGGTLGLITLIIWIGYTFGPIAVAMAILVVAYALAVSFHYWAP